MVGIFYKSGEEFDLDFHKRMSQIPFSRNSLIDIILFGRSRVFVSNFIPENFGFNSDVVERVLAFYFRAPKSIVSKNDDILEPIYNNNGKLLHYFYNCEDGVYPLFVIDRRRYGKKVLTREGF